MICLLYIINIGSVSSDVVTPFPQRMRIGLTVQAVHTLHAMDASLAHLLALAHMETAKASAGQENDSDTQQKQCCCNKTKRYKRKFQHNSLFLHLQR